MSYELDEWLATLSDQFPPCEELTGQEFLGDRKLVIMAPRGRFERWLDRHNHKMAFLRTIGAVAAAIFSGLVLIVVLGVITV
jgi:hypothetical protein